MPSGSLIMLDDKISIDWEWQGRAVPPVLLSGHHAEVARWRRDEMEAATRERRPDLWTRHLVAREGAAA